MQDFGMSSFGQLNKSNTHLGFNKENFDGAPDSHATASTPRLRVKTGKAQGQHWMLAVPESEPMPEVSRTGGSGNQRRQRGIFIYTAI